VFYRSLTVLCSLRLPAIIKVLSYLILSYQDAAWYGGRPHPRGLCVRWGPSPPAKFSAHVYYSYCDFVRTFHIRYSFVQVQVLVCAQRAGI